jgi:hypothetical protein
VRLADLSLRRKTMTLEYVKQMYSKFVSTLGESNYNRELYRTDWMHLIRSQAFVNLWWKAHRAYDEGRATFSRRTVR